MTMANCLSARQDLGFKLCRSENGTPDIDLPPFKRILSLTAPVGRLSVWLACAAAEEPWV